MNSVMGLINLSEDESFITEVTQGRPLAALPFGGRYRLIDFTLSNMVNSDIANVGILLHDKFRALMDHLRSGKEWDLARKQDGLFILPPVQAEQAVLGDLQNIYQNRDYLLRSRDQYVLVSGSSSICNIDYRKALAFHVQTGADVTLIYNQMAVGDDDFIHCTTVAIDDSDRIVDMEVNAAKVKTNKVSMGMYLLDRELLIDLVDQAVARGETDFVKGIFLRNLNKIKICGFCHYGYLGRIHSIASYYRHNMALLRPEVWQELFFENGLIYTKVKDEAPTSYGVFSDVRGTLVANGCLLDGTVSDSVLFRGVKIHHQACVRDSLIMQNCEISEGAVLEHVICDKGVKITKGKRLIGEKCYPLVIKKGTVI
ncbi:glucose-1-phosphate adenylyltransferase [Sporomusaceae bacterium BoRhaA]|uniref:glucose-1-phosphate adenylyltransferase subunit GlgD n=1 Tax=Pelorhabdus rhamnosifermentans TaxID=2772457 RepID=UPI001C0626CC|nr:glucose-1-phosphate adenylyltransferase subunit GlgD [Pelorhabdus rhamnosifermentans]MBU2702036.1 glucose-1-phosphate adenylyltransferase [Pelorhabdus rhamnosifermentans]